MGCDENPITDWGTDTGALVATLREAVTLAIEDVLLMDSPEGDSPRNIANNLRSALPALDTIATELEQRDIEIIMRKAERKVAEAECEVVHVAASSKPPDTEALVATVREALELVYREHMASADDALAALDTLASELERLRLALEGERSGAKIDFDRAEAAEAALAEIEESA